MKINDDVIKVIIEQAKKDAPIESCGLLLGKDDVVTERFTSIPSRYWKFKAGEIQAGQLKSNRVPMGISSSGGGGNTVRNMMVDDRSGLTAEEEFDVYPYVERPGTFRPLFPQHAGSWHLRKSIEVWGQLHLSLPHRWDTRLRIEVDRRKHRIEKICITRK